MAIHGEPVVPTRGGGADASVVRTLQLAVARIRWMVESYTSVIEPAVAGGAAVDKPAVATRMIVRIWQGRRLTLCHKKTAGR